MTFFVVFSKKILKLKLNFFSKFVIPISVMRAVRVIILLGVAYLACKYDCSNPCSFGDMMVFSFF